MLWHRSKLTFYSIEFFRNEIEQVKAILGDKELDVYSLARLGHTAVETIFTNMAQLIKEGAVKAIGVSEMSSASLEKAHKVIVDLNLLVLFSWLGLLDLSYRHQRDRSLLISYEPSIRDSVAWCTAHSVPILAYSPLGRGQLTRRYKSPRISLLVTSEPCFLGSKDKRSVITKSWWIKLRKLRRKRV